MEMYGNNERRWRVASFAIDVVRFLSHFLRAAKYDIPYGSSIAQTYIRSKMSEQFLHVSQIVSFRAI